MRQSHFRKKKLSSSVLAPVIGSTRAIGRQASETKCASGAFLQRVWFKPLGVINYGYCEVGANMAHPIIWLFGSYEVPTP